MRTRRNFLGTLFGGWLMATSGLKLDTPALPAAPATPIALTCMWAEALPITEVERHLFAVLKAASNAAMDQLYMEHANG